MRILSRHIVPLAACLMATGLRLAMTSPPAHAAGTVFTVNTTADTSDILVVQGGALVLAPCVDALGNCSLRGALQYASFGPNPGGSYMIIVPAGLYVLNSGTSLQAGNQAASTTIQGAGAASTIIDGNSNGFPAIVVNTPDGTSVTIDGVTIQHGAGSGGAGLQVQGSGSGTVTVSNSVINRNTAPSTGAGGIFNTGTLILDHTAVSNNSAFNGGGGITNGGSLTVRNGSTIVNNTAVHGDGGGILNAGNTGLTGTLSITNSTVNGNTAPNGRGGGIASAAAPPQPLTISSSQVAGNTALAGGGLWNGSPATISATTFGGNQAITGSSSLTGYGGGIAIEAAVSVALNSDTVNSNTASGGTGLSGPVGGAGIYNAAANLTIWGGSITNNCITSDACQTVGNGFGGGIDQESGGSASLDAVTLSNNTAASGGGLFSRNGNTVSITASTFSNNRAIATGGGIAVSNSFILTALNSTISGNSASTGGGFYSSNNQGSVALTNLTIAFNSSGLGTTPSASLLSLANSIVATSSAGPDCSGSVTDLGYNLASDNSCGFTAAKHDLSGVDPKLVALAINAPGSTATHSLRAGSPALDAGGTAASGCPPIDQRGVSRPQGAACDIGAYEAVGLSGDVTPPVTTATANPPPHASGWHNTSVTVTLSATDDLSGVDHTEFNLDNSGFALYSSPIVVRTDGTHTVLYRSIDKAGNVETTRTLVVKLDQTPPVVSCASPDGLWHAADIVIPCSASDSGSGLANASDASFSLSTSVPGGTETASASTNSHQVCDSAVNCTTAGPLTGLKVDKKPPTVTFSGRTPAPTASGWNNTSVVLTWTCTDGGSGVLAATVAQTVSTEGRNQSATGTCTDQVDISTSDTQAGINIDRTPPVVSLATTYGTYTVDQTVSITCSATDALSGVASTFLGAKGLVTTCQNTGVAAYALPLGNSVVTASATDMAGNTATASRVVTVDDTPTGLCLLTKQFIEGSHKYESLNVLERHKINLIINSLCTQLTSIHLTPSQKTLFVQYYRSGVAALVPGGWLAQPQATILTALAANL